MTNGIGKKGAKRVPFEGAFAQVLAEIERSLRASAPLMREYTDYLASENGKFIRTQGLLSCALDNDGTVHENAVKFAAAIEILHLATLVHDDVIDDADTRRGKASLQKVYGKKRAVICGDYLFCVALSIAAGIKGREDYLDIALPNYVKRICLGEMNQLRHYKNLDLSAREYLKTISGKTAALFEASFYAGAILCTEDQKELARYRKLGRYTGMVFQLMDDLSNYEADKSKAHKPVQSDYEQGVITLPLIRALKEDSLRRTLMGEGLSGSQVKAAVESAGGLAYTKAFAGRYYDKGFQLMEEMALTELKKARLTQIIKKAFRDDENTQGAGEK